MYKHAGPLSTCSSITRHPPPQNTLAVDTKMEISSILYCELSILGGTEKLLIAFLGCVLT